MGEIADSMINGSCCSGCGTYIGEATGYPRECSGCQNYQSRTQKQKPRKRQPNRKCLIWNPYTETLKVAYLQQTLKNWYAVIGTNQVEQFYLEDGEGTACLYADDSNVLDICYGVQLPDWGQFVVGILLFIGPPDRKGNTTSITNKAIAKIKRQFKAARILKPN